MSLRDVERAMQVMVWFYQHVDDLGRLMRRVLKEKRREEGEEDESEDDEEEDEVGYKSVKISFFFFFQLCKTYFLTVSVRCPIL